MTCRRASRAKSSRSVPFGRVAITAALVAIGCATASPAEGAIRSGSETPPPPKQAPSLNAPQYSTTVQKTGVSYDDATGQVSVVVSFAQAEHDFSVKASVSKDNCDEPNSSSPGDLDITIDYHGPDTYYGPDPDGQVPASGGASATLLGFEGTAEGTLQISGDGRTLIATLQNNAFKHRDWRCVVGSATGDANIGTAPRFDFYFGGFAPITLTSTNATQAVRAALLKRFGASAFGPSPYIVCPDQEISQDPTAVQTAYCTYQLTAGHQTRRGDYTITVNDLALQTKATFSRTYSQRLVTCRAPRDLRTYSTRRVYKQRLRAPRLFCGDTQFTGDIQYAAKSFFPRVRKRFRYGVHGTGTGFYTPIYSFNCKSHGRRRSGSVRYSMTCANQKGDRYVYSFSVKRA